MVAHAQAQEAGEEPEAFERPTDVRARESFRGSYSGFERDAFFRRVGPARYVECGFGAGLDLVEDGRAAVTLDVDGDGDLDLAVLSLTSLRVLRNESPPGRWLRLRLVDAHGGPGLGAVVRLTTPAGTQVDRARLTAGFQTQTSPRLHFGLGAARVAEVTVAWPGGAEERFPALAAGHTYELRPGQPPRTLPSPSWPRETWPRPVGTPGLALPVRTPTGERVPLARPGRPAVVSFFAPSCAACQRELPALAGLQTEATVVAVSVGEDAAASLAFARAHGGPKLTVRLATDELVRAIFGAEGRVRLPTTLVMDGAGAVRRAWHREVSAPELGAALRGLRPAPTAGDHALAALRRLRAGRAAEGRAELAAAVAASPGDAGVLSRAGWAFFLLGAEARGLRLLRRALAAARWDGEVAARLGAALARSGQRAEAQEVLSTALALDPRSAAVLTQRATLALDTGDLKAARADLRAALEAAPDFGPARALRGRLPR